MPVWDTIGKVRITPKGQFDSSNEYEILDMVYNSNMNKVYIAKQDVPVNSNLSDATYWIKMLDVSDASIVIGDSIANNLTTTESGKVLDARQGKALNENKLGVSDVVDNLTTSTTGKALDASQGKILNESKLNKSDVVDNLTTSTTGKALDARQGKILNEDNSKRIIRVATATSIPSSGSSVTVYVQNLTAQHYLILWNFSSSAENLPPADLTWTTYDGRFTITNNGGSTSETICPVFILGAEVSA